MKNVVIDKILNERKPEWTIVKGKSKLKKKETTVTEAVEKTEISILFNNPFRLIAGHNISSENDDENYERFEIVEHVQKICSHERNGSKEKIEILKNDEKKKESEKGIKVKCISNCSIKKKLRGRGKGRGKDAKEMREEITGNEFQNKIETPKSEDMSRKQEEVSKCEKTIKMKENEKVKVEKEVRINWSENEGERKSFETKVVEKEEGIWFEHKKIKEIGKLNVKVGKERELVEVETSKVETLIRMRKENRRMENERGTLRTGLERKEGLHRCEMLEMKESENKKVKVHIEKSKSK